MKEYLYKTKGFTYIELLIVVGIMLIFGAFLVASVNPVERIKAQRDSQRESDLNSILLSVQQKIKNDRGWDCPSEPLPQDKFTAIGTGPGEYDLYSCLLPNYLSKYLVDPKEGSSSGRDITDGLVGHWKFDEGTGTTAYDASGNGNDGTIVNSPTWVDGKMGEALDFDGTNDYIQISNIFPDDQTISAWIKTLDVSAIGNIHFQTVAILHQESQGAANDWGFGIDTNGMLVYGNGDSISEYDVTSLSAVNDNIWHFVAVTREKSSGKIELYIDGVKNNNGFGSTTSLTDASRSGNGVQIGRSGDASPVQFFNGTIDDVRIYNRALSSEEIQDLYNYEYSSKYAVWQNPVTKNISLKSLEDETKEVSTGAPELALNFDGSNDYVEIPGSDISTSNLAITKAITLSAWAKFDSAGTSVAIAGRGRALSSNGNYGYFLSRWSGNNKLYFDTYSTTARDSFCSTSAIVDSNWHCIVVTWDGTTSANGKKIYIDGELDSQKTSTISEMGQPSYKFRIGADSGSVPLFNGQISDVRIYNRALSAEEVEQLYKGYDIRNGLVGHWPLNEGTGTTAYDRSGNNNNGTLLPAGDGPTWTTK